MIVLGLSDGPDAAAALVVGGRLVAAVSQERIDRQRHSAAFPSGAVDAVLDRGGVRARDVDRVVLGGAAPPLDALGEALLPAEPAAPRGFGVGDRVKRWALRKVEEPRARHVLSAGMRATGLHMVSLDVTRRRLEAKVRGMGFEHAEVDVVEEDRAQAWGAYRSWDADDVLVVVLDAARDGAAVSVWTGRHGQVDRHYLQTGFAPLCGVPSRLAARLGVDEGQLAARTAGAAVDLRLVEAAGRVLGHGPEGLRAARPTRGRDPLDALADGVAPEVWAASLLVAMEDAVVGLVRHWSERTGSRRVALSGTLCANPRLVARVWKDAAPLDLWVTPGAGAGATAIGAALGVAGTSPARVDPRSLGPAPTDQDCYRALSNTSLPRRAVEDPVAAAAAAVARGEIVARVAGPMAFGARTLGSRCVFFRADRVELRERAQAALARSGGAPPGSALRVEDAEWLATGLAAVSAGRTGTLAVPASDDARRRAPGVVHVDGTALPQVVHPEDDPDWHRLLGLCAEGVGVPVLAVQSFNPGGQPVVNTPGDAVRVWRASGVDRLFLGPYELGPEDRG